LAFNGSNSVAVGQHSIFNDLNVAGLTVIAWIYPTSNLMNSSARIVDKDNNTGGWIFEMNGTTNLRFATDGFTGTGASEVVKNSGGTSIVLNTWQQVAVTWDGTKNASTAVNIYINGTLANGTTTSNGVGTYADVGSPLTIGNRPAADRGFIGRMANVSVYNYVLSQAQIAGIAVTPTPSITPSVTASSTPTPTPTPSPSLPGIQISQVITGSAASGTISKYTTTAVTTNITGSTFYALVVTNNSTTPTLTMSDSKTNGWTRVSTQFSNGGNQRIDRFHSSSQTGGSAHTFSVTAAGGLLPGFVVFIYELRNVPTSNTVDTVAQNSTTSVPAASGNVTITPVHSEMLISTIVSSVNGSSQTFTANNGFTVVASNTDSTTGAPVCATAYRVVTTSNTYGTSWTPADGISRSFAAVIDALFSN
jgi:hypothetical protein